MSRGVHLHLWLVSGLILLTLMRYGIEAFAAHPWTMADDARQFLTWGARISNPAAMPGNLLADYWQQTAPPLYRGLLYAADGLGVGPVLLSKLLAFPLILFSGGMAWRLSRCFADDPRLQTFATLCIMAAIIHNDSIFSGTPRAFASPIILVTMLGIATQRHGLTVAGLLTSSILYPAPAITGLGIFALQLLRWRFPLRLALSWRAITLLGGTAMLVLGAGLYFKAGLRSWGPTLSLDEARHIFGLATTDGRSSIVGPEGDIAWICSPRIGFLPAIVNCQGNWDPRLLLNACLTIVPMISLWIACGREWKRLGTGQAKVDPVWRLFPNSLVSSLICYVFAAQFAFAFHLPARYSQPVLLIMGSLALGLWIGRFWVRIENRLACSRPVIRSGLLGMFILVGLAIFATPKMRLKHPHHTDLIALIASTPPNTVIAGVSDDLDMVPAETGRAILASPEHDIPYHRRYHRESQARLRASMLMGQLTHSTAMAAYVRQYKVDLLVFDRRFLETGMLPESYRSVLRPPHRSSPSLDGIAALRADSCRVIETRQWVAIFTTCI
ncbi:hypothetical protein [Rhizorhapis suberifaciens]|uniref:Glycosyltransferase RgtA/B/C/D-like domain-containing protein n=1 Tax=Rhizorhapis suberifaciens TaxID=13656 RepID=A0A840HRP6_9SPHN|nr:hypothetical protein [Rhizorhapis suberifaciens]MBB4640615.1 hypothetical protein [Rhizorhapis suberifaciens]